MMDTRFHAIYTRLSKAVNGQTESVERQEQWGRAYAAEAISQGRWPDLPIRVFCDNGISAWKDDAERPDYNRLRAAIRAGHVDRIWVVEQTRIEASRRRWVELSIELETAGIECLDTNRDGLVRLDEVADIKNVLASHERGRMSLRIRDTLDSIAAEGRPPGGQIYGYRHDRGADGRAVLVVQEREAEIVRECAARVLSGWSIEAIVKDLRARKIPTRQGKCWHRSTVTGMLQSPTIAGKRVHRGEIIGDGNWTPILDEVTWRRLQAFFDTGRGSHQTRRTPRKYLLSGLLVCGRCGTGMTGRYTSGGKRRRDGSRYRRQIYVCAFASGGCGRMFVHADPLHNCVIDWFLAHLASSELLDALAAGDPHEGDRARLTAALEGIGERRRALAVMWAAGELSRDEWEHARGRLENDSRAMSTELAALPEPEDTVDPATVLEVWGEDLEVHERRALMGVYIDRIVVAPAGRPGPRFDPGRVTISDVRGGSVTLSADGCT